MTSTTAATNGRAPTTVPPVLEVCDLTVEISTRQGPIRPVEEVSLTVDAAQMHGVVGESGCGKSTLLRAIIGLLPKSARIVSGRVLIDGVDLVEQDESARHGVRGATVGMVFQDPSTALSPVLTIGSQLMDGPRYHLGFTRREAARHAIELLDRVGVPEPERRMKAYPHQLSGGLRQRAMIAIALASGPRLLLCDEPTTALDVTIQDQILGLLDDIRAAEGVGIVFVSHNLAIVSSLCRQVSVMYAGRVIESGVTATVFSDPGHPYTAGLMGALPDVWSHSESLTGIAGAPPDLAAIPPGCSFAPRCCHAVDACSVVTPPLVWRNGRYHACLRTEFGTAHGPEAPRG